MQVGAAEKVFRVKRSYVHGCVNAKCWRYTFQQCDIQAYLYSMDIEFTFIVIATHIHLDECGQNISELFCVQLNTIG